MSSSKIKESLLEFKHESETIKNKVYRLLENLDSLDKEYLIGYDIMNKRSKGIE